MTSEAGVAAAREAAATAQHCLRWLLDETADATADGTAEGGGGDLQLGDGGEVREMRRDAAEMREMRRDAAEMREIRRRAEEELAICLMTEAGVLRRDPPQPPQTQPQTQSQQSQQPQLQPPSQLQQQRGRRLLRAGHHASAAEAMGEVAQLLGTADADGAPPGAEG